MSKISSDGFVKTDIFKDFSIFVADNTIIGEYAAKLNKGSNSVIIGTNAGKIGFKFDNSTIIGPNAGSQLSSSDKIISIGNEGPNFNNLNQIINIGHYGITEDSNTIHIDNLNIPTADRILNEINNQFLQSFNDAIYLGIGNYKNIPIVISSKREFDTSSELFIDGTMKTQIIKIRNNENYSISIKASENSSIIYYLPTLPTYNYAYLSTDFNGNLEWFEMTDDMIKIIQSSANIICNNLDVGGITGNASFISNININTNNTDELKEGLKNLYFNTSIITNIFYNYLKLLSTDDINEGFSNSYFTYDKYIENFNKNLRLIATTDLLDSNGFYSSNDFYSNSLVYYKNKSFFKEGESNIYYNPNKININFDFISNGTSNFYFNTSNFEKLIESNLKTTDFIKEGESNLYYNSNITFTLPFIKEGESNLYNINYNITRYFNTILPTTDRIRSGSSNYYFSNISNFEIVSDLIKEGSNKYFVNSNQILNTLIFRTNTDIFKDGTSNAYFKEARVVDRYSNLLVNCNITTDNFLEGTKNKFITNNFYNNDLIIKGFLKASNINDINKEYLRSALEPNIGPNTEVINSYIFDNCHISSPLSNIQLSYINDNDPINKIEVPFIVIDNKVGICTPNPRHTLDVNGNINCSNLYLNNLILSKNDSNLEIKDSNNNFNSISVNKIELNSNNSKLSIQLKDGELVYTSNGNDYNYLNYLDTSNIIYSTINDFYNNSSFCNIIYVGNYSNLSNNIWINYNNGNIGIGTINPLSILHIHNHNDFNKVEIKLTDYSTINTGISIRKEINEDLIIENKEIINGDIRFITGNNERLSIITNGNVGIGIANPTAKLHIATPDNVFITTDLLNFKNTSDYGIYAISRSIANRGNTIEILSRDYNSGIGIENRDIITLRPEGNVGIGANNPTSKFTIKSIYNDTNGGLCLDASDNPGVNNKYNLKLYPYVVGVGQVGYKFQIINNISSIINDVLVFDHTGNVGIGFTPGYKLDINGNINFTGSLYQNGNLFTSGLTSNITSNISSNVFNNLITNIKTSELKSSNIITSNLISSKLITQNITNIGNINIGNINSNFVINNFNTCNIINTDDYYLSFTNVGTTTIIFDKSYTCDILIVGGGGGGGTGIISAREGAGGGAGGVLYMVNKTFVSGIYKITIGDGGVANTSGNNSTITDTNNNIISFDNINLIGKGGGGGASGMNNPGLNGGSGGGGVYGGAVGGTATQGNTFWNGTTYVAGGYNGQTGVSGAGGGASEAGGASVSSKGGHGRSVNITGNTTFYGGGGSSFNYYYNSSNIPSLGGGGVFGAPPTEGTPNTGGGGGGSHYDWGGYNGAKGGSGIVILRFKNIFINGLQLYNSLNNIIINADNNNLILGTNNNNQFIITPTSSSFYNNLGIGIANAREKLHVNGTIASINNAVWDHIRMWHDGSIGYIDAGGASRMAFRVENTASGYPASSYSEILSLSSDGNVGIGIANPYYKLDVLGIINSSTRFKIGNTSLYDGLLKFHENSYSSGKISFGVNVWQTYEGASIFQEGVNYGVSPQYANRLVFNCTDIGGALNNGFWFSGASYVGISQYPDRNYNLNLNSINLNNGSIVNGGSISATSLNINSINLNSGNVGIGTDNPIKKLHVVGEIAATGNITANYSDERLKIKTSNIDNPINILNNLNGYYYKPNELAKSFGFTNNNQQIGLSAQEVNKVIPEIVKIAPFDMTKDENGEIKSKSGENYLTIDYQQLIPVLIEAIKELNNEITKLKIINNELK